MGEWLEMRWLRLHAMFAPFGIAVATALLLARSGKWSGWESLESAATLVDLGAVVYGMAAVLAERGVRMVFWALDQRRQWREKWRKEAEATGMATGLARGRTEGRAEGRTEGRAEGRTEGRAEGRAEERERILRAAKEMGIDIAALFPDDEEDSE